ncbi:MAG: hypothetical protein ABSF60_14165 [Verrucomicrobiota bacterium]|jgi:hypothetical protein
MITLIEFILAGFLGWIVSVIFLDYYESERPQHRIENSDEFENYKKGIQRAKNKLSFGFGLLTALAWLVIYRWLNISN